MAYFVRVLTAEQQQNLQHRIEDSQNDEVRLKRLQVIQLSSKRLKSGDIAGQPGIGQATALRWIKRFNKYGFACFEIMDPAEQG